MCPVRSCSIREKYRFVRPMRSVMPGHDQVMLEGDIHLYRLVFVMI